MAPRQCPQKISRSFCIAHRPSKK